MKKIFKRDIYIERIKPFIDKDIIKVLVGQRRVGKSYILLQLIEKIKDEFKNPNIIYINKELSKFSGIKNSETLTSFVEKNSVKDSKNFLFIDEIQDIVNFEISLRSFLSEGNFDIYCTGSNSKMLSGDLATYLSGRYVQFQIHSLCYNEFLEFHSLKDDNKSFLKYMKLGGLPYLHNIGLDENVVNEYLKSVYNTIILRDIVARYNIRNIAFLERLNLFLADSVGSLVTAKRISDFLKSQNIKISTKLIIEYLLYLESAFFIQKVSRFDIKGRKIFELNDKYYFTDLGLRNTLKSYTSGDINKLLENIVFNKLRSSNFEVYVGKLENKEIDFVAIKGDKTIYVQVAYLIHDEKVHDREFGNLLKINDNHRKIVVSMDEFAEGNFKGIEHKKINEFLLEKF